MAATGSALAVAAAALPAAGLLVWDRKDVLRFRAVAGLPADPLPAYASYVIEGRVDLAARTGRLTKKLYAGPPEGMSGVTWPGMTRTLQVTDVRQSGSVVEIAAVVDDPSTLRPGETGSVAIRVDGARSVAEADFLGTALSLRLR